jgi:hypothetical protein
MATNRNQEYWVARTSLCTLILLLLPFKNSLANTTEPALEIEAPDNWYQVEVILFTQNGNIGGEAPPQNYQLSFPENWLQLIDPNMPLQQDGFPLAQGSLLYQPTLDESLRMIPMVTVTDPLIAIVADPLMATEDGLNVDSLLINESADIAQTTEPEELYVPQYETPFLLLDKEFRELNESAAALDRRQYNVVFHEAWRFAADEGAADPWVVIKAGQRFEDRFQLEGSLRFYKSRFLHFESDLWLLQFANIDTANPATLIELPDFPTAPESAEDQFSLNEIAAEPMLAIDESQKPDSADNLETPEINSLEPLKIGAPEPVGTNSLERFEIEGPERFEIEGPERFEIEGPESLGIENPEPALLDNSQPQKYPVDTVWILNKSKRIEEQTIYYIDHPEMGIMLTIKPVVPELLNPPQQPLDTQVEEFAQDTIAQPIGQ